MTEKMKLDKYTPTMKCLRMKHILNSYAAYSFCTTVF